MCKGKLFGVVFFVCLMTVLFFSSCQIGLGASVDTQAPTVAITYPPASAVIKGTFKFSGTWTDDQGVTTAKVSITKVNSDGTTTSYGTVKADVDSSAKTWTVSLNAQDTSKIDTTTPMTAYFTSYKQWELSDGTYELSVTAYDEAGHSSGKSSRSIDIDNTAPVLILNMPLAYGSGTPSVYGQKFKLYGDISDLHKSVSLSMDARLYDNGALSTADDDLITLTKTSNSSIQMSETNPLILAEYNSTSDEQWKENYVTLYGEVPSVISNATSKEFYSSFSVTDNAMTYNTVGDSGVAGGNTTSFYYLDNDALDKTIIGDKSTYKLSAEKLTNIINGTNISAYTSAQLTEIKTALSTAGNYVKCGSSTINTESSSVFTLNPNASPTYTFSGYTISTTNTAADQTTGFRTYTTGGTISLSINAGKDNILVKPRTVKVSMYKLANNSSTDITGITPTVLINPEDSTIWDADPQSSVTKQLTISDVSPGAYYRLVLSGTDKNDNEIVSSENYPFGFKAYSSTQSPDITITSPTTEKYYKNTASITATGSVTFYTEGTNTVTCDTDGHVVTVTGNTWTDTISLSGKTDTSSPVTVTYTATDSLGQTKSVTFKYDIDNTAPVFTTGNTTYPDYVNSASYTASNSDNLWYKSANLPISGCWTEAGSGIKEVYYCISTSTGAMTTENYATNKTGLFTTTDNGSVESYSVGVGSFVAGANYLTLVAVDNAGNTGILQDRVINIDMDAPSVEADSTDSVMTNGKSDITIKGLATDGDSGSGIASVTVYVGSSTYTISSTATTYGTITLTQSGTDTVNGVSKTLSAQTTRWVLSIDAASASGTANSWFSTTNLNENPAIYATVTDKAGNVTAKVRVSSLQIDQTAPVVAIKSPTSSSKVNGTHDITGTVTETYPAKLQLFYRFGSVASSLSSWKQFSSDVTSESALYNWTFSNYDFTTLATNANALTNGVGTAYLLAVAYDKAGNCNVTDGSISATDCATYTVDLNTDRPTIKITNLTGNNTTLMYGTNASISGTVSDDDSSTANGVVYTFVASSSSITYEINNIVNETGDLPVVYYDDSSSTYKTKSITVTPSESCIVYKNAVTAHGLVGYEITEFDPSTGDFTYIPGDISDGIKTVYFYIVDCPDTSAFGDVGATFYTANTNTLYEPYIQFKSGTATDNSVCTTYTSDSLSPTISSIKGNYSAAGTTADGAIDAFSTSVIVGGNEKKYIQFVVSATDASGIKSMSLALSDSAATPNSKTIATGSNGSFTASTASGNTVWTTGYIDVSSWTTGSASATITVYDQSGLYSNSTVTFYLDNSAPTAKVTSPLKTDEVTGDVTVSGSTNDTGTAGVASAAWLVPLKSYSSYTDAQLEALTWNTIDSGSSATAWTVSISETNMKAYDNTTTYLTTIDTDSDGIYLVPFYILVKDTLGNYSITKHTIRHNPDANIPVAALTYPTTTNYDSDRSYATLGGTLRVSGTATDNVSVSAVYLQIDMDPTVGSTTNAFDSTDKTAVDSLVNSSSVKYYTTVTNSTVTNAGSDWWGIKVTNTSSWSITLNANSEFNSTVQGTVHYIRIRACAVDNEGNVGAWCAPVMLAIDNTAPVIGSPVEQLNQYSSFSTSATPTATNSYTENMYLKGTWYLAVSLTDESGIDSYSVKKGSSTISDYSAVGTAAAGYTLYIPIDQSSSSVSYTISAVDTDSTSHTSTKTYSFNIDNKAPSIDTLTGNGDSLLVSTVPSVANSNYIYTLGGKVTEENSGFQRFVFYFLRDSEKVSDGSASRVYDSQLTYSTSDTTALTKISDLTTLTVAQDSSTYTMYGKSYTGTCSGTTFTSTSGTLSDNAHIRVGGLIYIGGVYRLITAISGTEVTFDSTASTSATTAVFPYAQVVDNTATEKTSWNSTTHKYDLTGDDGDGMPESITKATTTYSWDATLYSDNIPDGPITIVCLAFDKAGNVSGKSIYTKVTNNAPRLAKLYLGTDLDGDGSYASKEFNTYTFNGTGAEDKYLSSVDLATAGTTYASYGTPFKIKKGLALIPELTGGNGTIKMVYLKDASSVTTYRTSENGTALYTADTSTITADYSSNVLTNSGNSTTDTLKKFVINDTNLTGLSDGTGKSMSFTFWDSTDGCTCGKDSNYCFVRVSDFTVDLVDETVPQTAVKPFYWNSLTDNSIYNSSSVEKTSALEGHIELAEDWANASGYDKTAAGIYDDDPKVSGKIVLKGWAYDDQRLSSLWFKFPGLTPTGYLTTDDTNSTKDVSGVLSATYYQLGQYKISTGKWVAATATIASNGWAVTISDSSDDGAYFDQSGHKVYWTLSIDTSYCSPVTAADVKALVLALDHSGNVASVTTTGTVYATAAQAKAGTYYTTATLANSAGSADASIPDSIALRRGVADTTYTTVYPYTYTLGTYEMDIVPYVQTVTTSLSTLKKGNASVYARTALGHYPVYGALTVGSSTTATAESFKIAGFNLFGASVFGATSNVTATATTSGVTTLTVSAASATTGNLALTVNGYSILNNVNSSSSCGAYTTTTTVGSTGSETVYKNYYNRMPNGDNNNLLTDDVVLDVWTVKDSARSRSRTLTEPVMCIPARDASSAYDVMRFAFTNGAEYFSMAPASSTTTSYQNWERNYADFNNVAFAYDSQGNSYGITTGLDTYPNGTSTFAGRFTFISSRWGICDTGQMDDNYWGKNKMRLEAIGIMKGAYIQGAQLTDNYVMDTRRFNSPVLATAVHGTGTGTSASTAVYLAYYDKFQKQIRFRYGTFTSGNTTTSTGEDHNTNGFDQFKDQHTQNGNNSNYIDNKHAFDASLNDYSLIAGKDAVTSTDTGNTAGKYVAIDVVPGTTIDTDVVVAVWYDGEDLQYSYKLQPNTDYDADQTHTATAGYWSPAQTIFTNGGKYCAIKVDVNGGIHIAAQDSVDQDLKYAYLSKYNATYSESANSVTVDSYAIVGTQVQIDTELENGKVIPYISYYNGATEKPKMAYLVPQTTMNYAAVGSDSSTEMFTGNWEVTLIPTSSEVQDDHINIGLWKTTAGVKRTTVKTGTDTIGTDSGTAYGNGTGNAVVGYATVIGTQGYIETAQMK